MKKSQQKASKMFDALERKMMFDIKSRRPLTEGEVTELESLMAKQTLNKKEPGKFTDEDMERLKELNRLNSYLKFGEKYPILSRNTTSIERASKGRRFVYIGIDDNYHIGRNGKHLKVARKMLAT